MDLKNNSSICCLPETSFRSSDTHRLKMEEWKKILHANSNQKRARGGCSHFRLNRLKDKKLL